MRTIAAFVLVLACLLIPAAGAQDTSAPPTTDQVRAAFRETIELCLQSVRSQKHFEDIPEAAGKLRPQPVARPAPPPGQEPRKPPFNSRWFVPRMPVAASQEVDSCTVVWIAKPYGATGATDLSAEMQPTLDHVAALFLGAIELPFYPSEDMASGRRFAVKEGERTIPFHVALMDYGDVVVSLNAVPRVKRVMRDLPFGAFENTCLRPLYAGKEPQPTRSGQELTDASLQPESGFIFYGRPRSLRIGLDPADPKACAYHLPDTPLDVARRAVPAEQWGVKLSVAPASTGGVIVVGRAP